MENNKFFLSGELVRNPYFSSNKKFGSATLKVYSEGRLEYISFICFSPLVSVLEAYSSGDKINAVCRLHSHSFEKDGNKIFAQDVVCDSIFPLTD